jgi:hypothetical protein
MPGGGSIGSANELFEELAALVGEDAAVKVCEYYQGEAVYFPKRVGLLRLWRSIYRELQEGASYGDMARKYHYSKTYIRHIEHKIRAERVAVRQPALREPAAAKRAPASKGQSGIAPGIDLPGQPLLFELR